MRRALSLALLLTAIGPGRAENWPGWRGPDGNAVSGEAPLPVKWSKDQNVRWKIEIPGEGYSSPIVWGDRVFLTSAFDKGARRAVHALDRVSGKLLWSREIEDKDPERTSAMTGHAAATPVTDGRHVVAVFGNAGVVCYDFAGKRLWQRGLGDFDVELGLASSPVLHGDRVFLVCDHDGDRFKLFDSYLVALDVQTGAEKWKTERRDLFRSWSTPLVVPGAKDTRELIVSGQDHLRAYDPETGKQLWQTAGTTNWVAPSPVFGHGLIFVTSGKDGPTLAVRPGGRGDVTETHVVWKHDRGGPYACSPVLYGDYLYVPTELGFLYCYEARGGKAVYKQRLEGKCYASPVAGDGKLYFTNDAGTTLVVKAGPKYELLGRNVLDEYTLASPAVSGGNLFLRTERHLYCVGPGR